MNPLAYEFHSYCVFAAERSDRAERLTHFRWRAVLANDTSGKHTGSIERARQEFKVCAGTARVENRHICCEDRFHAQRASLSELCRRRQPASPATVKKNGATKTEAGAKLAMPKTNAATMPALRYVASTGRRRKSASLQQFRKQRITHRNPGAPVATRKSKYMLSDPVTAVNDCAF